MAPHRTSNKNNTAAAVVVRLALLLAVAAVGARAQDVVVDTQYNFNNDKCVSDEHPAMLVDAMRGVEELSTLVSLVDMAGSFAEDTLGSKMDKKTLFAPTNYAFERFYVDFNTSAEEISGDAEFLKRVLQFHTVPSVAPVADFRQALGPLFMSEVGLVTELQGNAITVNIAKTKGDKVRVASYASAAYLEPEESVWACNGVIQPINYVLVPRMATVTEPTSLRVNGSGGGRK